MTQTVMARLLSVNVGLPRDVVWNGRTVHTGIWKNAVDGPRTVRKLNVDGDGQGDLAGHGGEQRAVFVYQVDSYRFWERELHRNDFVMGQFGENFTVDGLGDDEVCIGDRYRIGTALFEVTQPRVTCYRVGIRMNDPRMPSLLVARRRPGFYFRVLQEGVVEAGDAIEKVAGGPESMTVAEIDGLLYLPEHSRERLECALKIPALSPGWQQSFRALVDGSGNGNPGIAPPDVAPAAWAGFRKFRIASLTHVTSDIVSIELESLDGTALTPAQAGQYVVVRLRPHPDEPEVMRSFSLCNAPGATRYRLGIKCEPKGAVSTYLAESAKAADLLDVSAPRGAFVLGEGTGPVVLLSAGIGVTPVLAMLQALSASRSSRTVWWLYGARNLSEHPFGEEVRGLLGALQNARSYVRYSQPGTGDRIGVDFDSQGHLDIALLKELGIAPESDFYMCGPAGFLRDMQAGLAEWGVTRGRIHTEVFGSGPSLTPGIAATAQRAPHPPPGAPGIGPQVSFARSDLAVRWDTSSQSLLDFAESCDVPVRWSCRTGVCHNCESGLISGTVAYDPEPLEPPATGNLLLCCSKPTSDVVLDL